VHADVPQQVVCRSALRDDLEAGVLEQPRDAFAQQDGVVCKHYTHAAEPSSCGAERGEASREPGRIELVQPFRLVDAG
jgi:hypothetical protein